jgi:hypothetical protein
MVVLVAKALTVNIFLVEGAVQDSLNIFPRPSYLFTNLDPSNNFESRSNNVPLQSMPEAVTSWKCSRHRRQ